MSTEHEKVVGEALHELAVTILGREPADQAEYAQALLQAEQVRVAKAAAPARYPGDPGGEALDQGARIILAGRGKAFGYSADEYLDALTEAARVLSIDVRVGGS